MASVSPGKLIEIQILQPHQRLAESVSGGGAQCFHKLPCFGWMLNSGSIVKISLFLSQTKPREINAKAVSFKMFPSFNFFLISFQIQVKTISSSPTWVKGDHLFYGFVVVMVVVIVLNEKKKRCKKKAYKNKELWVWVWSRVQCQMPATWNTPGYRT